MNRLEARERTFLEHLIALKECLQNESIYMKFFGQEFDSISWLIKIHENFLNILSERNNSENRFELYKYFIYTFFFICFLN
jgi:hypothetical protein